MDLNPRAALVHELSGDQFRVSRFTDCTEVHVPYHFDGCPLVAGMHLIREAREGLMDLERVQRAGVSLFATKGFAATGIRELGGAAGINSATLYHYVGSKEDLLVSIMRACLRELIDAGVAALRASSEPVVQLAGLVSSHVGISAVNQLTARVAEYEMRALSDTTRPELQEMRDEYEALFAQVLERGQRVGVFTTQDLPMARLAIMEMGTGVAHWYRPEGRLDLPTVQGFFVDMACRILSVDPAALDGIDYVRAPKRLPSEPDHITTADQRRLG